ncbi:hypothetical protein PN487_16430 [Microcystis aeruginosa CS-556/03]|nr:hypothetical protein [Microcystis aeruginosa]MDB9418146.1 hypothetical protein [Microcystis aeruginosa CS-556/03]
MPRYLSTILPILKTFPWDSSEAIITLKKEHLIDILDRYLNNALSATDLENWADAIECREDIAYETDEENLINDIIFDLANPTLNDPLSPKTIEQYISQFSYLKSSLIAQKIDLSFVNFNGGLLESQFCPRG